MIIRKKADNFKKCAGPLLVMMILVTIVSCSSNHYELSDTIIEIPANHLAISQISDTVQLYFMIGLFAGESEYIGIDGISLYETVVMDLLKDNDNHVYFFEFNLQYQNAFMSPEYTPVEFFEYKRQSQWRYVNVVVVIDADVKDFQLIGISRCDEGYFIIKEIIFNIAELSRNQPFNTSWRVGKPTPVMGISFVTDCGQQRVFTITENFIGDDVPPWRILELDAYEVLN